MADTRVLDGSCNDARFGACTSTPPTSTPPLTTMLGARSIQSSITDAHVVNVPYNEANSHKDDVVRWGGLIVDIENEENHSLIQVQFYPLNESGHPQLDQPSEGEFVIKTTEFLDQETYYFKHSEITAVGTLNGYVKRRVQGEDVSVPLIVLSEHEKYSYIWSISEEKYRDADDPKGKTAHLFENVVGFIMTIPFCALAGLGKSADDLCIGMFANSIRKIYMDL
jgi:outer membrane lipoprotein